VVDGCTIVSNPTSTHFTNCPGANLGDANLSGANLSFADFAGAAFVDCGVISGTLCNAADLSGATLSNADLSGASFFDGVIYEPCGAPRCLEVASGAADLSRADLSGANLSSAHLHDVNLGNAILTHANLTSATFTGCIVSICQGGATLTGANLTGATLTGADFSGTVLAPSNQSVLGTSTGAVITWPAPQSLPGATPGTCTATSGSTFPLGTTTVTCQVLDDNADVATGTFTVDVSQVSTSTGLSSSVSTPVGVGARVIYTADVASNPTSAQNPPPFVSGGTVAFTDNGTTIPSCSAVPLVEGNPSEASCSVTFSSTGSHVIQPVYSGSGIFLGSYGQTLTQNVVSTAPPTTSVVVPSNGATISGSAWLDASASSPVGVASVSFEVTGPGAGNTVIATGTPTLYGWLAGWNTTNTYNGTYTLQSVATDANGTSSTSAPITITVNNPLASTSVIIPSTGATQSGTAALLDASASGNAFYSTSVYKLIFEISGGPPNLSDDVIATGTPTLYGQLAQWNTTSVPNGTYTLQSVGFYPGGMVTSAPITISVDNSPPTTSVLIPSSGASQSGTAALLDATTTAGVTSVRYELSGNGLTDQAIATGTPTLYGWLAQWNTTSVANGTYTLQSVAAYSGGVSGTSASVTITVNN
jgi:uncharacterized protein YjbI with pentapeptide repeats